MSARKVSEKTFTFTFNRLLIIERVQRLSYIFLSMHSLSKCWCNASSISMYEGRLRIQSCCSLRNGEDGRLNHAINAIDELIFSNSIASRAYSMNSLHHINGIEIASINSQVVKLFITVPTASLKQPRQHSHPDPQNKHYTLDPPNPPCRES